MSGKPKPVEVTTGGNSHPPVSAPHPLRWDRIIAVTKDGVLAVILPKMPEAASNPTKIAIAAAQLA